MGYVLMDIKASSVGVFTGSKTVAGESVELKCIDVKGEPAVVGWIKHNIFVIPRPR